MNKLWKFLNNKIWSAEQKAAVRPFLHEIIDFDVFPVSEYIEWRNGANHDLIKQRLRQAFFNFRVNGNAMDKAFEFYDSPMSKGFVLFHRPTYSLTSRDYRFFQHDISEICKELRYVLNLADVRSRAKGNGIEKIFKYYLKPSSRLREGVKARQLYGNISIEFILRDEKPYMLRLLANSYRDQNFHPPLPFRELVSSIVE